MGILPPKEPTVPLALYQDLAKRYDDLLAMYHELRMQGANPVKPGTVVAPRPEPEHVAVRRAEDESVRTMARHIAQASGIPEAQALEEVERIRRTALSNHTEPA